MEERALFDAADRGEDADLRKAIRAGVSADYATDEGWTLILSAAIAPRPDALVYLIDAGAEIDQQGDYEVTPLIWAISVRNCRNSRILLDAGADLDPVYRGARKDGDAFLEGLTAPEVYKAMAVRIPRFTEDEPACWAAVREKLGIR